MHQKMKIPRLAAIATAALLATGAQAVQIDTGDDSDWAIRWDNTLRGSLKIRTKSADPALTDSFREIPTGAPAPAPATFSFPQALNFNGGDQNFQKKGFVSERVDLLSEFDAVWNKNYGFRISGAAWYDQALHKKSDADNDPFNGQSPYNAFPGRTRRLDGGDAELLDAFAFGTWRLDNGMNLTAKVGQHALQYGEGLFFGDNGIARAQGPVDIDKLLASPNAQFKEILLPVPQLSSQLQLSPTVSVGGYYQFKWEADRLPGAGSYFSTANIPWGAELPEYVDIPAGSPIAGTYVLSAATDQRPKNSGQFGLDLKWRLDESDLGFYFARYHDKDGQLYGALNPLATPSPYGTLPGTWFYKFPGTTSLYGVSASRSIGDFNVAGEASIRNNVPLRSGNTLYVPAFGPQPQPAMGRTAHVNLSTLATFGPSFIAQESSLVAELAWNRLLKKNDPDGTLDAGRSRGATAIQAIFTPTYRQAVPGLDLSVPVGARYVLAGSSSVASWDSKGSGNLNIGVEGNYLAVWQFNVTYTDYLGKAVPFVDYSPILAGGGAIYGHGNALADRNYVSISLRRTF